MLESMETGPFGQYAQQLRRNEVLVPDNVGHAGLIETKRGVGRASGQDVYQLISSVGSVPIAWIPSKAHLVIEPPGDQFVGAAGRQGPLIEPAIAVLFDSLSWHNRERWKGAEIKEKCQ